jgi:Fe-S cluster biogenesis protein NfuA
MTTAHEIQITVEITPNPNTLKFNVNKMLLEAGSIDFPTKEKAQSAYLASEIFKIDQVNGVHIGTTFVTVTKKPDTRWEEIAQPLTDKLKSILSSDKELFPAELIPAAPVRNAADNEIEQKIREILDNEIRPAVAMDGGDITFHGYENGTVTLHLQGSCSSCPSSVMTLKMGVENRLKQSIPEIKEVVQV